MAAPQIRVRELLPTRLVVRQSTWPLSDDARSDNAPLIAQLKSLIEKL